MFPNVSYVAVQSLIKLYVISFYTLFWGDVFNTRNTPLVTALASNWPLTQYQHWSDHGRQMSTAPRLIYCINLLFFLLHQLLSTRLIYIYVRFRC